MVSFARIRSCSTLHLDLEVRGLRLLRLARVLRMVHRFKVGILLQGNFS